MKKILIVEDEPTFIELLQRKLSEKGYQVYVAVNGDEGLKRTKDINPDLVLLDIRMPVMDGITMLEKLRQDEIAKNIKVLILTNYEPDEVLKEKVGKYNAPIVIKSNVKLENVLEKVDKLLG